MSVSQLRFLAMASLIFATFVTSTRLTTQEKARSVAGIASRYANDRRIGEDASVVLHEDFEQATLELIGARWDTVRHVEVMSLSSDVPLGSGGKQSLLMSQLAEKGTGGDLYRRLSDGYDKL